MRITMLNTTPAQQYIVADLLPVLEAAIYLDQISRAELANALEQMAIAIRTNGRQQTYTLPETWTPYVRMTQRSMHADPQAQKYLAEKFVIGHSLKRQIDGDCPALPRSTPLAVHLEIAGADHGRDLDNEAKAILDVAQGIVYPDDRWIDHITATRGAGDESRLTESRLTVGVIEEGAP